VLFESQEGNNTRARYLVIGADLFVSSFTVPATANPGATMLVTDTVMNQGGDAAAASTIRFYWSANSTLDTGDVLLASRAIPALEPAASASGQTRFYLSTNITLEAADVLLAESRTVAALSPGASSSGTTLVTIPPGTAPGAYYILAKADAEGSVSESTETNNAAPRGIQIVN
jgi:subtilase family serine protease